ncbi:LysM peptidoglycan-binding domain-containing protein [Roseicyclus persicicus]|uniref:LysM peptidoglycan-binding domain-containing protein n=1 Tax=Roseicyclus persicicus TaxID=2650661 RepID=A0A7X6JYV0_9RHOB|nr:LysM peptidoglycan-binding domain-containing protein [Roseibacterium persicicum]NKX46260.1 LysM peptidoglycan-binding domain-containing protein [Roseibacterium persicicum]
MATPTSGGTGAKAAPIAGAAALGAVLVAAAVAFVTLRGGPEETPEASAPDTVAAAPGTTTPAPAGETATADTTAPDAGTEQTAAPADPVAPRFDVVRVEAGGSAVIAGQAGPGATVTLSLDGAPLQVVEADAAGNFVAMLLLDPSQDPRLLSLQAALPGQDPVAGSETVLIAPFEGEVAGALGAAPPPAPEPAQSAEAPGVGETTSTAPAVPGIAPAPAPAPGADLAAAAPDAAPEAGTPAPAPVAGTEAPAPAGPEAPAVLLADADGVRVLQAPGAPPAAQTEIRLDAITYDVAGEVTLAGRGPADASVRVTLNNRPINMGEIGPGGQWSLDLPDVDPGTYTLRLEQVAADGSVARTVETPFLREDPARIRDNPMLVDPGASVITVQRGFTLWGIAEANFGDGILYVQIFEENRDAIRDPDLIFPGQIFALPDLPRAP